MKALRTLYHLIPFFTVLVLILGGASLRIGDYPLLPSLFLIPIFYWLVFRPGWLPLWSLCCLGVIYDALMGHDIGLTSLLLMTSAIASHMLRPYLNPDRFLLIWGSYCAYSFVYMVLYALFISGGLPLFVSWIYGIILYPLLSWVLSHVYARIQVYV
jgi:cell shape-determining protein MreD